MKTERIEWLEKEIGKHDESYWGNTSPEISDIHYDNLTRELTKLDPTNPLLTKVHTPISTKGLKVQHKIPMRSLAKVYTIEELLKWCNKVARNQEELFKIEIKYDGCSADFTNGVLATRGDGKIGEDITDKIPLIKINGTGDIRGEIVFRKSMFEKFKHALKKKDGSEYSNGRNACAGILNKDDLIVKNKILELVPFNMETTNISLKKIPEMNFQEYIKQVQELDFPADGLVISLADKEYGNALGFTSHHPKGKIALKFANDTAETKLLGVTWSCGKEVITPIGNVEPVEIGGVTVSNVSLHNWDFIAEHSIHIGDTLTIERAGDVIPHVISCAWEEEVDKEPKAIEIDECPECGSLVKYKKPNIYCTNDNCKGKKVNKLYDAITRIGIDRIGKPTIKNMVNILEVDNLIDILQLTKESLLRLPKFGDKKASNTLNEIHKVNNDGVYEWQVLAAINIPGIGRTLSKTLCKEFGLNALMDLCLRPNGKNKLMALEGIEEKRATDIVNGVKGNIHYLSCLRDILYLKFDRVDEEFDLPTVCLTGKFPEQKSYYYEKLKGRYEIVKSVTKSLDILVVADPLSKSSKCKKAKKLGIKIESVEEILTSMNV
jgi:DNA ligase (NAD+)